MSIEHGGAVRGPVPKPSTPDAAGRKSWVSEIRDAVSLRTTVLVIGTLLLGLGFVLSYVGALHSPRLQNAPVTVVSTSQQATQQLVGQIDHSLAGAIAASPGTTEAAARAAVADRATAAAFVYHTGGSQDTLIVASAAGAAQATAIEKEFVQFDLHSGRTVKVEDVVPANTGDFDGLSTFYLVVGWSVTGYLIASILGLSAGTRPSTPTRAAIRLVALALCGLVGGVIGTVIVQRHALGALGGAFGPMVATGTLLVFGVGAITMAMEIAFGIVGIGLAVLLVVVLGNPSAGGAFPRAMLPPFWRAIGAFLPPGAGTDAVRSIAYFGGAQTGYPLLILGGYALLGLALTMLLCVLRPPKRAGQGVVGNAIMDDVERGDSAVTSAGTKTAPSSSSTPTGTPPAPPQVPPTPPTPPTPPPGPTQAG